MLAFPSRGPEHRAMGQRLERAGPARPGRSRPQIHAMVRARGEQPRLVRVPRAAQHAQALVHGVVPQPLDRHDHRALHQVGEHLGVQDADGGVVGRARQEGELTRMEHGAADGFVVILKRLVRLRAEVEVEPNQAAVVRAHDHVVPGGVDGHRRYPLGAAHQLLQRLLLLQVVNSDAGLRRHEKVRLRRMEGAARHLPALQLGKRSHRLLLVDRVNNALVGWRPRLWAYRSAIIALRVPS
mmetsp:Transcript_19886/g.59504  ORF Transcript_19886/g.59504 Transcript_19886/m.59504 type:complete len:240 (+) Transcript_19886:75-794(+)